MPKWAGEITYYIPEYRSGATNGHGSDKWEYPIIHLNTNIPPNWTPEFLEEERKICKFMQRERLRGADTKNWVHHRKLLFYPVLILNKHVCIKCNEIKEEKCLQGLCDYCFPCVTTHEKLRGSFTVWVNLLYFKVLDKQKKSKLACSFKW